MKAEGELMDVSAGGLSVRLAERVEPESRLTAEVFMSGGALADLLFSGEMVKAEPLIDPRHDAAVRFERYQVVTG